MEEQQDVEIEQEGTRRLSAVVHAQYHNPRSDEESFDFEAANASSDDSEVGYRKIGQQNEASRESTIKLKEWCLKVIKAGEERSRDFPKSIKPFIPPQFPSNLKQDDSHCIELVAVAIPQGNIAWNVQVHVSGPVARATRKSSKSVSKKAIPIATIEAEAQLNRTAKVENFMKDINWTRRFLPTLTQALYTSSSPFMHFTMQSSQFLQTVQAVFDLAFPTVTFVLQPDDKLVSEACKRMRTQQSLVAKNVLEQIQAMFAQEPYYNDPKLIRSYVVSALRPDGAAYFAKPQKMDGGDNEILEPEGFLQRELILSTAQAFLPHTEKSIMDLVIGPENPPVSLYVLILTVCKIENFHNAKRLQTRSLLEATQRVHEHAPDQSEQMMLAGGSQQHYRS
ncbi:hypothetical protein L208DRAFT_1374869 [Tricholoma matsutake]|nr:hypothetical protein L208DRAFT_1374869 [Tricholoma matsutake 945]